jgi:TorA maturation chaperone TorD
MTTADYRAFLSDVTRQLDRGQALDRDQIATLLELARYGCCWLEFDAEQRAATARAFQAVR